jgi:hypothetical protein
MSAAVLFHSSEVDDPYIPGIREGWYIGMPNAEGELHFDASTIGPYDTMQQGAQVLATGAWLDPEGFSPPPTLMAIAEDCRAIVKKAEAELGPLPKKGYLDLVADNLPRVPLETLKAALVCAGVGY